MPQSLFPPLSLDHWRPTRDTIQGYAQVIGKIRRVLTPPQKHWWHISLRAAAPGLTSTPIHSGDQVFELLLDFTHHRLLLTTSHGHRRDFSLKGQSLHAFSHEVLALLAEINIDPEFDREQFAKDDPGSYDESAVADFWQAFSQIDAVLKEFRHGLRKESSPVQLWPHHFDLAVLWFSGRLVPDQDPDNPEYADEQMNFGFSTGDEGISEPYFYATAYPTPEAWTNADLVDGAYWHSEGWTGAVLPYARISGDASGAEHLLDFLKKSHHSGAALMK